MNLRIFVAVLSIVLLSCTWCFADEDLANERIPKQGLEKGKAAYLANCAACHQPKGTGMPGAFPPLAASDFLSPPYKKAIEIVLKGQSGPLVVNGKEYNNVMPAMSHLSDEDLANIFTYVVNSWSNPGGKVTADFVASIRKEAGLEDSCQG